VSSSASDENIVALLLRRWKSIALFGIVGAALGVTYALLAPEWFRATLTVIPSQRSQDATALSLAAKLPGGLGEVSTDVQRIRAVLTSNSVTDEVIARFNLKSHYGVEYTEHARAAVWSHCEIAVDRKSSVVSLACEDRDPERARGMAAYFGEVGNRVFKRISSSSAREERSFLEKQLLNARKDVDDSSRKLREFQEEHHIIDLGEQSKAVISAMASIEGELVSKQLQLSYLTSFSSRTEPAVVQLQQQIGIMQAKLRQLEDSQRRFATVPGGAAGSAAKPAEQDAKFFPEAMRVPELRFQLEALMREQKIRETVFVLLTQRFETAKVDEARDTSTFQILDEPTLPTYRARPQRKKVAVVGLLGGLLAGVAFVVIPAWLRQRTRTPL
jgi:tyrosine-protein kinase Etk/Wzc